MTQYFDAVLDGNMQPVYNGTPEQTYKWLSDTAVRFTNTYQVCRGVDMRMFEIADYLKEMRLPYVLGKVREAIEFDYRENSVPITTIALEITQVLKKGRRVEYDDRYGKVLSLVHEASDIGDPNAHAHKTAAEIIELFE